MAPKDKWDGVERRQHIRDDHDAIVSFAVKIESLYRDFNRIEKRQYEYEKDNDLSIRWLRGIAYTGIGIILAIQFLVIFIKR